MSYQILNFSMRVPYHPALNLANQAGHFIGLPRAPSCALPMFDWSAEIGDLCPAHFLSLYTLQLLPLKNA